MKNWFLYYFYTLTQDLLQLLHTIFKARREINLKSDANMTVKSLYLPSYWNILTYLITVLLTHVCPGFLYTSVENWETVEAVRLSKSTSSRLYVGLIIKFPFKPCGGRILLCMLQCFFHWLLQTKMQPFYHIETIYCFILITATDFKAYQSNGSILFSLLQ